MIRTLAQILLAAMLLSTLGTLHAFAAAPAETIKGEDMPTRLGMRVDIVFVFDSTGSMDKLIVGVKADILGIMRTVTKGDPSPDVRFGIVTYRDKRSDYIEKHIPLTRDHALARKFLSKTTAAGGAGEIAHVDLGMHIAVSRMNWDWDKNTARVIFLFGDMPPHGLDPAFSYKHEITVARERGITVNTVACMDFAKMVVVWKEIAKATGGEFRFMVFVATLAGSDGASHIIVTDCDSIWVAKALPPLDFLGKHLYFLVGKFRTAGFPDLPSDIPSDLTERFAYIVARSRDE